MAGAWPDSSELFVLPDMMLASLGFRRAVGLLFGVGCTLSACSGNTSGGGSDAQQAQPTQRSLVQPPPPLDLCGPFQLEYDLAIARDACPEVGCDCFGYLPVSTARGCVVGLDCSAVCSSGVGSSDWVACATYACQDDADCASGVCVLSEGASAGMCGEGSTGSRCANEGDCPGEERCVAVDEAGGWTCVRAYEGSPCNKDEHCAGSHCVRWSGSYLGACSAGLKDSACLTSSDCQAGLACHQQRCGDGSYFSSCTKDDDCARRLCVQGTCTEGNDGDGCNSDGDCDSSICVHGSTCVSGEVDAYCSEDDDCHSGRCAANNYGNACTDGKPGAKCLAHEDCLSGVCQDLPVDYVPARFLSCL
ncbi:MAG TPA: hypothetical protein VHP33_28910 [Polyangiaceae bacterium]|nr:hypothetical protein [Polyangiaceae bacterium]